MNLTTLKTPGASQSLCTRLYRLTPDAVRMWGSMPVEGMLCHLGDAFNLALRDALPAAPASWAGRTIVRPLALHVPIRWMRNAPTVAQVQQGLGGTPPSDFLADRERVLAAIPLLLVEPDLAGHPHPIMGPLTHWEWMRWAWLHTDHHLRQFSA